MGTYLTITQDAERESSTIQAVLSTVVGQIDRHLKFVKWVERAWTEIQNSRADWLWMRGEYDDVALTIDTIRYSASDMGITTRFARWITSADTVWLYDPDTGVSDEAPLRYMAWREFRNTYIRGSHDANKPTWFSVSPANEICFGPKPDKAYPVSGEYRKSAQTLSANADEPECDARFHIAISDYANILMAEHDEAELHIQTNRRRYEKTMGELRRDQLETFHIGAPPLA